MAIRAKKFTVTSASAVRLSNPGTASARSLSIKNLSTNSATVFVGGTSLVDDVDGFPIEPGAGLDVDLSGSDAVWAIAEDGETVDLNVIATRA